MAVVLVVTSAPPLVEVFVQGREVTCGVYEPLITPNRSMVPVFRQTGMRVRYTEARDGHSWENWRDRLREGFSWIFPGQHE